MSDLVVVVPGRPPTPNVRLHWAALARSRSELRGWARLAALEAIGRTPAAYPYRAATVEATFLVRSRRRRDPDNLIASLKPLVDGLVDAGVLTYDDRLDYRRPIVEVGKVDAVRLRITGRNE